jgi:hypothetical protein
MWARPCSVELLAKAWMLTGWTPPTSSSSAFSSILAQGILGGGGETQEYVIVLGWEYIGHSNCVHPESLSAEVSALEADFPGVQAQRLMA